MLHAMCGTVELPHLSVAAPHRFVRRGVVGSHKDEMTADVIREFDLWSDINLRDYKLHSDDFATYSKYEERAAL